jgi:hypothetical protein
MTWKAYHIIWITLMLVAMGGAIVSGWGVWADLENSGNIHWWNYSSSVWLCLVGLYCIYKLRTPSGRGLK